MLIGACKTCFAGVLFFSKKGMTEMSNEVNTQAVNRGPADRPLGEKRMDTKKLATFAILAALAYVVMVVGRIPIVLFLKYDPKDVIIAISGFIYGPLSAFVISVVVSLIEMVTVSDTGPWGLLMNVLSTCVFVCPAAYIYKKNHTIKGAVIGLVVGGVLMIGVMLLWNYLVTPFYMGIPREKVEEMLFTYFLPFNALKAGLNGVITILLYKPVVQSLRKARLIKESEPGEGAGKRKYGVFIVALVVLATLILLGLVLAGKI